MRVIVLGAGGVGSVVAGYLARAGYDVVMIARPGHTAALVVASHARWIGDGLFRMARRRNDQSQSSVRGDVEG